MNSFHRARRCIPGTWKSFFSRNLFGLLPDADRRIPEIIRHNRLVLASRYLKGSGIEIGALGTPCPVPPHVTVKFLDRFDDSGLYKNFPELANKKLLRPDIIDNAETMETVADASQDFLIANHVIEHLPNPLLFLKNASRVLKKGGILFLAIPDRDKTFDSKRPVTSFEHLLKDFTEGPAWSRAAHYEEYVRLADTHNTTQAWKTEAERLALTQQLMDDDYSIHYHVWDVHAMMQLFCAVREKLGLPIITESMVSSGNESVFILSKQG